jgi:hypothetical protein
LVHLYKESLSVEEASKYPEKFIPLPRKRHQETAMAFVFFWYQIGKSQTIDIHWSTGLED